MLLQKVLAQVGGIPGKGGGQVLARFSKRARTWIGWALLAGAILAGCGDAAKQAQPEDSPARTPTPLAATPQPAAQASPQPAPTPDLSRYQFPAAIDPTQRYLFYLHGKIIEDQGLPAISPQYGEYEYAAILENLAGQGLQVISDVRPRDTDGVQYAEKLAGQVERLLQAGVPPGQITIAGASKGAAIAAYLSNILKNEQLNFVLLGSCHPDTVAEWQAQGLTLYGNLLSIYDYADTQYSGSCQEMFTLSQGKGLGRHAEIVLQVGSGHGVLYQPLDEWLLPTLGWAKGQALPAAPGEQEPPLLDPAFTQEQPLRDLAQIQGVLADLRQRQEAWYARPGWYQKSVCTPGEPGPEDWMDCMILLTHVLDAAHTCGEQMVYFEINGRAAPFQVMLADGWRAGFDLPEGVLRSDSP
jgi:hypothetical protein